MNSYYPMSKLKQLQEWRGKWKMKVLYLAAGHALIDLPGVDVVYQDKFINRDIAGDMLDTPLNGYDVILASPPCNFWSRANHRRLTSHYSLATFHLLPGIIKRLENCDIPILIENVINKKLMNEIIHNTKLFYYEIGRHSYFTNRMFDFSKIPQARPRIQNLSSKKRQGTDVNIVFKEFIKMNKEKENE